MAFAVFVIVSAYAYAMQPGDMGEGSVHAFMACFYYCWPLYFLCAILTQWIVIVPLWEAFVLQSANGALVTFGLVGVACIGAALGVASIISDDQSGYNNLIGLATIMLFIQLAYWGVNFFIMFLVTGKTVTLRMRSPIQPSPEEST
nr:hypothetical protein [Mucilaginibacter sp. FT3.2]